MLTLLLVFQGLTAGVIHLFVQNTMSPWALIKSQLCCNYELFIEASYKAARCSCVVVRLLKQGGMLHIGAGCHVSRYLYETRPLAMYAVGNMVVLNLYIQKWEYLHWYIIQWALNVNEGSMKQLLWSPPITKSSTSLKHYGCSGKHSMKQISLLSFKELSFSF